MKKKGDVKITEQNGIEKRTNGHQQASVQNEDIYKMINPIHQYSGCVI